METKNYLESLRNTYIDKAFFIEKLPPEIKYIVDYGCADGGFLVFLRNIYGDKYKYIGIEPNGDFLNYAMSNKLQVFHNLEDFYVKYHFEHFKEFCINFSSSLHEIYQDEESNILTTIMETFKFGAVSVRDMNVKIYEDIIEEKYHSDKDTFIKNMMNIFIKRTPNKIHDFVDFKYIDGLEDIIHFLLKYFYTGEDWIDELNENYLSTTTRFENILDLYKELDYDLVWKLDYNLPYLVNKWTKEHMLWDNIYENPWFTTHSQYLFINKGMDL
jgi:hypothetical protein